MSKLPTLYRPRGAHLRAGWLTAAGALLPTAALACSGPGAAAAIQRSGQYILVSFATTVLLFLALVLVPKLRRRVGGKGIAVFALACIGHPGLWLGTLSGDCGYTARWASLLFLPFLALLLLAVLRRRAQPSLAA